ARLCARELHGLDRRIRFRKHREGVASHLLTHFRHHKSPGRSVDQPNAEASLQSRNAAREARLGNLQGAGRLCVTTVLDHLGEVVEVVQGLHAPTELAPWIEQYVPI